MFNKQLEVPKYSRMVGFDEIEQNEFNLNLPRYIDSQESEDKQDIEGHLCGGIPEQDIDELSRYWEVCPQLKASLFKPNRPGYLDLAVEKTTIKTSIYEHPEFVAFRNQMDDHFAVWSQVATTKLKELAAGFQPKDLIAELSEGLLTHYTNQPLIDNYRVYQHLMDYWAETMQDDCYLIAADGWEAKTYRVLETVNSGKKKGQQVDKGWACDLVPKSLLVARYYQTEQDAITQQEAELEATAAQLAELEEEHGGEEGAFADFDKINKAAINARLKEIRDLTNTDADAQEETTILKRWLALSDNQAALKKQIKAADAELDTKAYAHYPKLTEDEIKSLVVDDKWMTALRTAIEGEIDRISQSLTQRVMELTERYENPLPQLTVQVNQFEGKVNQHLEGMGFSWM